MGRISYIVLVKTGDKKFSGTDANVSIILYGCKGIKTEEFVLDNFFRNDFESGTIDSFPVESNINIPQIERIELWRDTSGISSSWYVDWIEVKNRTTAEASIFPVFRWIKGNYHYCIQHLDTSLSQCDKYPNQRYMELSEKRMTYQLKVKFENGPAQVYD